MKYKFDCRYFSGYKPCWLKRESCSGCDEYDGISQRIAIISLEALGAVLRSTVLLEPIRRKYQNCHITWVTLKASKPLLHNNPLIDRIITLEEHNIPLLFYLDFDLLFAVDKSQQAGALAQKMNAKEKYGFGLNRAGVIVPLNGEADYQYDVGLNNQLKFFINQDPETQQTTQSMGLSWQRDPYVLELTSEEKSLVATRRGLVAKNNQRVLGFNTGCSTLYPYKKFSVPGSIEVVRMWREKFPELAIVLLGGREDTERVGEIKAAFSDDAGVYPSPTTEGLRSGICWMDVADTVFTGCSLGLHMAIALKKRVIAWFGATCSQEIDLYDRGIKLKAKVDCSPCWKKSCDNEPKCYDKVSIGEIEAATRELL